MPMDQQGRHRSLGTPGKHWAPGARHRAEPGHDPRPDPRDDRDRRVTSPVTVVRAAAAAFALLLTVIPWFVPGTVSAPPPHRAAPEDAGTAPALVSAPETSAKSGTTSGCPRRPTDGPVEATVPAGLPGSGERYRFCWALVNGGEPVTTVTYPMTGAVTGPAPDRGNQLALLATSDPRTCDTRGRTGMVGYVVAGRLGFRGGRAVWKAKGGHLHPEGRTLRIVYVFVEAPSSVLDTLEKEERAHRDDEYYPGVLPLPASVTELASFSVRAVEPESGQRCD
jgi:hypothetical protein